MLCRQSHAASTLYASPRNYIKVLESLKRMLYKELVGKELAVALMLWLFPWLSTSIKS